MIETLRHLSVFVPEKFGNRRIDVIGVGATGSKVVLELAKLGITSIHVWDYDIVESHNVANQAYSNEHIGMPKVEALYNIVKEHCGTEINIHNEEVDGSQVLGPIIFLMVDSMKARKEIWNKAIRLNRKIEIMIESRMGMDHGIVYSVQPARVNHIKEWEATLFDDSEAVESLCGSPVSVGPTSSFVSSMCVWQFISWYKRYIEVDPDESMNNEVILSPRTGASMCRKF